MVDDEGATLASGVVSAVRGRYPQVGVEVHPAVRGRAPFSLDEKVLRDSLELNRDVVEFRHS
jgi:hypothetical protein